MVNSNAKKQTVIYAELKTEYPNTFMSKKIQFCVSKDNLRNRFTDGNDINTIQLQISIPFNSTQINLTTQYVFILEQKTSWLFNQQQFKLRVLFLLQWDKND